MAMVSVVNMADRQVLSILIEPIKQELGASDVEMGALTGLSFAIFHVAACLPIALWADRSIRRNVIALGVGAWSFLTLLTGFSRSFLSMFVIRMGVGVGEATGGPPAHSLLSDYYPPERRSGALSVMLFGAPVGSVLAFTVGGWVNEWYGWRMVFILFGAAGLVLAPLIRLTIREPARWTSGEGQDQAPPPLLKGASMLLSMPSFRHVVLGSALNAAAMYTFLIWAGPFLMRVHGMGTGQAGTLLALGFSVANGAGILFGGHVADRLGLRDPRWIVWAPALSSFLAAPLAWGFVAIDRLWLAIPFLAGAGYVNAAYLSPLYAASQTLAKPRVRALASAFLTLGNTLLGLGIGPVLVGWFNELGSARFGSEAIRYSIAIMLLAHWWGAIHLLLAARTYPLDVKRSAAD